MKALLLRAIALASLAPLLAHAEPQVSTSGPCSPIGASGGSAEVRCTFEAPASKRAKVVVKNAWLRPALGFMRPSLPQLNETVALTVVLRNLSDRDVLLNAARLELIGAKGAYMRGSQYGGGVLQRSIGDRSPIRIAAGKTAEIAFDDTITFPGLIEKIETSIDTSKVMVMDELTPPRSNGDEFTEQLANLIAANYGKNAFLRASLFTEDYQLVQSFKIPLGKTASFFYDGERADKGGRYVFEPLISYDAFLGCYLKLKALYFPDFKIAETPTTCLEGIPDDTTPFGYRYQQGECRAEKKSAPEKRLPPGC